MSAVWVCCPVCCAETGAPAPGVVANVAYRCPVCWVRWWAEGTRWWVCHHDVLIGTVAGLGVLGGLVCSPWWLLLAAVLLVGPWAPQWWLRGRS